MSYRQKNFAPNEWYHCYTRSIDKQTVFRTPKDYERFLETLYLVNGTSSVRRGDLYKPSHTDFFELERGDPLVAVGAYCLMPNHFHLLLQEKTEKGISKFMQRLGTGFTKYFNTKYDHIGNVFIGPFRSKHVAEDRYLKHLVQYIHLNPIELSEPGWKQGIIKNKDSMEKRLHTYQYGSLPDYYGNKRPQRSILDSEAMELLGEIPLLADVLEEAAAYYTELPVL